MQTAAAAAACSPYGRESAWQIPISVLTDSYKATHYLQYPGAQKMVAVG